LIILNSANGSLGEKTGAGSFGGQRIVEKNLGEGFLRKTGRNTRESSKSA
jgi:hypothetical protein